MPMTTAYEVSSLVAKLKARGVHVAEETAKGVVDDVCSWFEESAKLSATPFDDIALVVVPQLKKSILEQVDKIDGVQGN